MNRIAAILIGTTLALLAQHAHAGVPLGWFANGSGLSDYSVATDRAVTYEGHPSVSIVSTKTGATGFAGLMQSIAANDYKGKRVRLSAYLRTRNVSGEGAQGAHLWFRVDGPNQKMLGFDNMDTRPVKGNTEWTRYEVVLDVPSESIGLAYGAFLNGNGASWVANFKLEQVTDAVPVTNGMTSHPTNLNFDQ